MKLEVFEIGFRTRYSILINYLSYILHVALSTLFTIVVARRLSTRLFGLWATIIGIDAIISSIVYVWAWMNTRLYVRGIKDYIKTSFTLTITYSLITTPVMIAIGFVYNSILGWGLHYFTLAVLPLAFNSLYVFLSNSVIAIQPYYLGYGNFIRDVVKLVSAYITVYVMKMELEGAILSVLASSIAVDVFFISILVRNGFPLRLGLEHLKKVFRNAYIPLVSIAYGLVASLEKPLATAIARATEITAFLNVASIPRNLVVYAGSAIGVSIAPKLLSEPKSGDVEDFLSIGILLNTWVFVLLIVFALPVLSLYNPIYLESLPLYLLYSIDSMILAVSLMLSTISISVEKRDLYDEGRALAETPLFKIPMYHLLRSAVAVSLGSAGLLIAINRGDLGVKALFLYPIGWLLMDLSFLAYTYKLAVKSISFRFPWRELFSVIIASTLSATVTLFSRGSRVIIVRISTDLVEVVPSALLFTSMYLVISMLLSKRYKILFYSLMKHLFR